MEDTSLGGQPVFRPLLLYMDKGTLPQTEQQVLQG
jgi:hypothetical protein